MKKKTRLKGLRKIHFAAIAANGFATPLHLTGAKKLEAALDYELEQRESDDIIDEQEYIFKGGSGKLNLKSMTPQEYKEMFNNAVGDGLVAVKTTDEAPQGALLFERQFSKGGHKRLYCIYNVKFAPSSINAESCGDGTKEIDEELEFAVGEFEDNYIYITLDTDTTDAEELALISTWYTEVPPIEAIKAIVNKAKNAKLKVSK
ncbi:MAG: major tail protein [Paraclostridium sp.]